jgi:N-acetylmuramoyl-L-alanine amidase
MIQQQLIYGGFVPGVTNINSGWADGKFEQPTADAVTRFQKRLRAHSTPLLGQVWSDDWAILFNL